PAGCQVEGVTLRKIVSTAGTNGIADLRPVCLDDRSLLLIQRIERDHVHDEDTIVKRRGVLLPDVDDEEEATVLPEECAVDIVDLIHDAVVVDDAQDKTLFG